MNKQTLEFATIRKNGITKAGHSFYFQPKVEYKNGGVKWFDDTKLMDKSSENQKQ